MPAERTFEAVYEDLSRGYADMALLGSSSDNQLRLDSPESLARYADMMRPNIAAVLREDAVKEWIQYGMLVVLFAITLVLVIFCEKGWRATGAIPGMIATWPVRQLMRLRKDNLKLRLLPELLPLLQPKDAARIVKQFFLECG